MKTRFRRIVSFGLCALLFLTAFLPMTASAAESSCAFCGGYVTLRGSCVQNTTLPNILNTTTSVAKNPDNANLQVDIETLDGINNPVKVSFSSAPGVISFEYDHALYESIDNWPDYVYCAHNVMNGTKEKAYVCREEFPLVWD